jgi:hypothetical protein
MDYGDGTIPFNTSFTAYPWQTLRFTMQARDYNTDDNVSINVVSVASSGARTLPVVWEGPAVCTDQYPTTDGTCSSGVWQRVFSYTPQMDDALTQAITFNATDDGGRTMARARGAVFPAWLDTILAAYSVSMQWRNAINWGPTVTVPVRFVPFNSTASAPAFVDKVRAEIINGTTSRETLEGTPAAGATLPLVYTNCPIPRLGVFAYFGPGDPVALRPSGALPRGMAVSAAARSYSTSITPGGPVGTLQFLTVTWTPSRGQVIPSTPPHSPLVCEVVCALVCA